MKTGDYKNKLNVYGRENKKCKRCNNKIKKIKMSGNLPITVSFKY